MNTASCQLSFFSETGLNAAEQIEKGHPKCKCAGKNQKNVLAFCFCTAIWWLLAGGKGRELSPENQFASR